MATQADGLDDGVEATRPSETVDLHVAVASDQFDWLTRQMAGQGDPTLSDTVRQVLDQARLDDDLLAARAQAAGYAAVAVELAEQYRRDVAAGTGDVPGEEAALDLAACVKRCVAARERVELLQPGQPHVWPSLPTETDTALAEMVYETVLQVAVQAVREVRAERDSAAPS